MSDIRYKDNIHLKKRAYLSYVLERFMDERQCKEFDKQYNASKTVSLGQDKIKELKSKIK